MKNLILLKSTVAALLFVIVQIVSAEPLMETTSYLPQFETTRGNLETLEKSLAQTGELAEILKKGNDELSEAIKQYKQDRSTETKDRIYNLLGDLAGQTVSQIDGITSNKDAMKDGLSGIVFKMTTMKTTLSEKQQRFSRYSQELQNQAEQVKEELRDLARNIKSDPENNNLRREFRRKLYELRSLDQRYKTSLAHQRLNNNFASQIGMAHDFFKQLNDNIEHLVVNLEEQREFMVLKIGLLRDAAQMEAWLRDEGQGTVSAFGMMTKITELSQALDKFNAATDVLIEMNDIGTLIDSLPDVDQLLGLEGISVQDGQSIEDQYVDYFLNN